MHVSHEPLEWNSGLATGVREIDRQHRMLISLLNQANQLLTQPGNQDMLSRLIREVADYAIYHFNTEEELMEQHGYGSADPSAEENHLREHRLFAAKATELQQDIAKGAPQVREALFSFLNGWLVNHILETDRQLGRFLNQKQP